MERLMDEMLEIIAQMPSEQRKLFNGFLNLVAGRMGEMREEILDLESLLGEANQLLRRVLESGVGPGQNPTMEDVKAQHPEVQPIKVRNPMRMGKLLLMN